MDCKQKVLELQNEFLRRISCHETPTQQYAPLILQRIIECDDSLLEFTFGNLGRKLLHFANSVDFTHPEIISVFDGMLADDQDFAQECVELLTLAKYAKENNLQKILPLMGQFFVKNTINQNFINKIDIPQNNRIHVRLLKESKDREDIRLTKRMQHIDLQLIYKKGEDIWNIQPDNFTKFLRFDTAYQDDLKLAEKKVKRYEEMKCKSLADEVRRSIDMFREYMEQSYYGFNRITLTNAAVILAKSMGFSSISTDDGFKISVNRKFFGKYNFDPDQVLEFSPIVSQAAGSPIFTPKSQSNFDYGPRVYPLHEFAEIMPDGVKSTISLLESFPDAGNKPIFDHFALIVPGVNFPSEKFDTYSILDESGIAQSYISRDSAFKALDLILVKGKYIHPVLVGEKEGKCFFICYWN